RFVSKIHAPIEPDLNVRPHQFHLLDRYTAAPSTDIPCHPSDRWRTGVKPYVLKLDPKLRERTPESAIGRSTRGLR
ncbi:MAG TPA: hypothetical protein VKB96_16240, partial [Gammaproteobacteria bacterium]|nr:hypothetical protein [Gammaproteobacteria bacterium]